MNALAYRVLSAETELWVVSLHDQRLLCRVFGCCRTQWIISPRRDTSDVQIMQIHLRQIIKMGKKKGKPSCCLKQSFI